MPANPEKVALYCQGTFSTPNPNNQQIEAMIAAAADIAESGFGTVILGQWHVHADGSIYYNDSPLDSVIQALKVIPTALGQGGRVKKVLIDFGPFASDFQNIQANLASFQKTMAGVQAVTGINGFDWDLEQNLEAYSGLLVQLNVWAAGLGLDTTAAPYYDQAFWNQVQTKSAAQNAGSAWWNLQLYGGADYPSWVTGMNGVVPDPQSFLVPGWSIGQGATPGWVQSSLSQLRSSYPSLEGGFIWRYEDIAGSGYTTAQFAQGIIDGLGGLQGGGAQEILVPA
jgi:hypothetical protein